MPHSLAWHFAHLPDPRQDQGKRHSLSDMIVLAICAVICAADSWSDMVGLGLAKRKWFQTFLDLPQRQVGSGVCFLPFIESSFWPLGPVSDSHIRWHHWGGADQPCGHVS